MSISLADMLVTYRADISDLSSKMTQVKTDMSSVESSAQSSGSGILSGFKTGLSGILDFGSKIGMTVMGMQGIGSAAIGMANALLQPNASMEQTTVAFQTLLGKGKQTQDFLQQMKDFAAATPFEFPEVATAAQHMLAFGFAAKDVIPTLTNIGDAMGSMGKGAADIDHIVGVFGQMHAAGKLNAGDMMQIADEGVPAWKMLADAMGKTVPEVQKLTTQGLIPADTAIKAVSEGMHKMFGGGMAAQANTFNGLMSTLQDNAGAAMRAFTGPLFDAAKAGLVILGNLVSSKQFQDFATGAGKQIAGVFGQIGTFISKDVVPAFQQLGPLIGQIGAYLQGDDFAAFVSDVQTVGIQLQRMLIPAFQALAPYIPSLADMLQVVGGILTSIVVPALDSIVFPLGQFLMYLNQNKLAMDVFKAALIGIGVAFAAIQIGTFLATIPALVVGFIAWATAAGTAAIATIAATWPIFAIGAAIAIVVAIIILAVTHWGDIVKFLQGAWANVVAFFQGIWKGIQNIFGGIGNWFHDRFTEASNGIQSAWKNVQNFFGGVGQWFHDRGVEAGQGAQSGFASVSQASKQMGENVVASFKWLYDHNYYVKDAVDGILGWMRSANAWLINAWNVSTHAVVAAWTWLSTSATWLWNTVTTAIKDAATTAINWITDKWTIASNWLQARWQWIAGVATTAWNIVTTAIHNAIMTAVAWIQSQWTAATTWLSAQWNLLATLANVAWVAVSTVFSQVWTKYVSGPLGNLWKSITGWFTQLGTSAQQSGQNFVQMLANGISSGVGWISNAVQNIAKTIWANLGFHSPTEEGPGHDADTWMPNLVKMLSSGLNAGQPQMQTAVQHVAQPLALLNYPIRPSAVAVASAVGAGGSNNGSNGSGQTFIFEVDSVQLARMTQTTTDNIVRLKLGPRSIRAV